MSLQERIEQHAERNRWNTARSRNIERFQSLSTELVRLIDAANPSLQALANEAGVDLSSLTPSREPSVRYLPSFGGGPRRTTVVESLQWADLNTTRSRSAVRSIGRLWIQKIRTLIQFLTRNRLLNELDVAESTDVAIAVQMVASATPEQQLLRCLQRMTFQNVGWNMLKAQLIAVLEARQCVVCCQVENSRSDSWVCAECKTLISNFAGFCLIWDVISDGESSHLTCCAELKEKACRFFKHRQFTQATLNQLARWLRGVQPATSPATFGIQELLDLLDSRTPRIPRRPPQPQEPEPPVELVNALPGRAARIVLKYIWNKRKPVNFDNLPADAFREGSNRGQVAVLGMLKRLKSALGQRFHLYHLVLEFDKRAETVELIHEVPSNHGR